MPSSTIGFSLEPDPWMKWIYDHKDPRYHDPETQDLRDRRAAALRDAPRWMLAQAYENDILKMQYPTGSPSTTPPLCDPSDAQTRSTHT